MTKTIITAGKLLYHRMPYIAIFSFSLYVLIFVGVRSYYRFMPATWFIHIVGTPAISNGQVDSTLTLTFCRDTRYPNIDAVGVRSYYLILNGKQSPVGNYTYTAKIAHSSKCQYISLPPAKHPDVAGTYLAHTDLTFSVEGHRKVLSYDTSTFVLSDSRESLQQQIQDLQTKIDQLKLQLGQTTSSSSVIQQIQPEISSSEPPAVTSAPTAPQTQSTSPAPSVVGRVVTSVTDLLQRIL